MWRAVLCAAALLASAVVISAAPLRQPQERQLQFVTHEIATGLRGGYQLLPADLNRDGRIDLIAVASGLTELVWFENPSWQRHVLASGISAPINVAVADLDGDSIPEIALAHGFSTAPERSAGNVSLLTHGADVTQPWTVREIDRAPTSHRVRWYTPPGTTDKWLINAPLAGAGSRTPDYKGSTPIYYYRPPEFRREVVTTAEEGVVHAVEPVQWPATNAATRAIIAGATVPVLLSAGFLGVSRYDFAANAWTRTPLFAGSSAAWPLGGSSEISLVRGGELSLATIEPWHGNHVVVYRSRGAAWERMVIDSTVTDGHTLVAADLDSNGSDELIVGERGGARSVRIYSQASGSDRWTLLSLDAGGMAGAGCAAVDLNGDGRIDIACIGTATANLKWYENVTR